MKNAMLKNAFAEMKKTKSRFLSIFGIIAIGTGFFAGLLQSAPAMKVSSDHYYDRTSLSDIRLVSTYGFDDNDIDALKKGFRMLMFIPDISRTHTSTRILAKRRSQGYILLTKRAKTIRTALCR